MPSEASLAQRALEALGPSRDVFRSTVITSAEELRGMLRESGRSDEERAAALAGELGPFAEGRVDAAGLVRILGGGDALPPGATDALERAAGVLAAMAEDGDAAVPFQVEVPPGGDLRDVVRDALARAGRAFGAARAADLARTGAFRPEEHEALFEGLPLRSWTRGERQVAPPLVVRVGAPDLRPAGLGDFLEGNQKIVLVVEGEPAPPAALARLVTPGVMVLQGDDAASAAFLGSFAGAGVAALFPAGADVVHFVHDPRAGTLPWERVALPEAPDDLRARFAGRRWKEASWSADLEHLLALATSPAAAGAADAGSAGEGSGGEPVTTADRLAAWLLARTGPDDGGP